MSPHNLQLFHTQSSKGKRRFAGIYAYTPILWNKMAAPCNQTSDVIGIFIFVGVNTIPYKNIPHASRTIEYNPF